MKLYDDTVLAVPHVYVWCVGHASIKTYQTIPTRKGPRPHVYGTSSKVDAFIESIYISIYPQRRRFTGFIKSVVLWISIYISAQLSPQLLIQLLARASLFTLAPLSTILFVFQSRNSIDVFLSCFHYWSKYLILSTGSAAFANASFHLTHAPILSVQKEKKMTSAPFSLLSADEN